VEPIDHTDTPEYQWRCQSRSVMAKFLWTLWKLDRRVKPQTISAHRELCRVSETWFPYTRNDCTYSTPVDTQPLDADATEKCDK
jgi:hypothetical protein